MCVDITDAPKLQRKCAETWAFVTVSGQWLLGQNIGGSCNYIRCNVWDNITCPFPNFNDATVEVWEWVSYFTPYFTGNVVTLSC